MQKLMLGLVTLVSVHSVVSVAATENTITIKAQVTLTGEKSGTKNLLVDNGKVVSSSGNLSVKSIETFLEGGFGETIHPESKIAAADCNEALMVLAVGKGNVLPNDAGAETYTPPEILSLTCLDK